MVKMLLMFKSDLAFTFNQRADAELAGPLLNKRNKWLAQGRAEAWRAAAQILLECDVSQDIETLIARGNSRLLDESREFLRDAQKKADKANRWPFIRFW